MRKTAAILALSVLLLSSFGTHPALSLDEKGKGAQGPIEVQAPKEEVITADILGSKIKGAGDIAEAMLYCESAIRQCKTYEDYERLSGDIKKLVARQRDYKYPDLLYYACAKARVEELSYLTKKNDIDSGRIYMAVNEKYYSDALECLDKAALATRSKDLEADIFFLRFLIFKELFQPQKADDVFNEMINRIASYSADRAKNLAKLNEMSKEFSDRNMSDYAMKMKLVYASKVDRDSAKQIAEDIRSGGDKYFDQGSSKDALSTYDMYLQVAENYYDKDAMASKLMDIAEKYFNKGRYKDAVKYYSLYLFKYGASPVADYASYKLALCYYYTKDYPNAISKLEGFLKNYQNSAWFEKGFESLGRLYYEALTIEKAQGSLQKLIDAYSRRDTRDYAYLLIGILYYNKADYDKALETFKKIKTDFPRSAYLYAADALITDCNDIKKGAAPSYSFGSQDVYKIWEPYLPVNADVSVGEGATSVENKDAKPGEIFVKTKAGSKITFTMSGLEDTDRFNEYWQDKEDQSRLPREIKTGTEKDLAVFTWSGTEAGKFLDDKQTTSRSWQAPAEPGDYTITINIGDLALVRPPDTGTKKDSAKTLTIHVAVEK